MLGKINNPWEVYFLPPLSILADKEADAMKLKDIMSTNVVQVHPGESVEVAARLLAQYNIGLLAVCDRGQLRGLVTDRDLVTRCVASGRAPGKTMVGEIMTERVISAHPDMETGVAAHLMGREQIRRLPVVEEGKLRGIVSLGDMAVRPEGGIDAADALEGICGNLTEK